jgi:hypothetical protein
MLHLLAVWWEVGPEWLWHPLGQCAGTHAEVVRCRSYNAHSGIFGQIAILGSVVAGFLATYRLYRKHTECHVEGCSKRGHPVHGTPYRACHEHHPASVHNEGEAITAEHIRRAHLKRNDFTLPINRPRS